MLFSFFFFFLVTTDSRGESRTPFHLCRDDLGILKGGEESRGLVESENRKFTKGWPGKCD